jgi:TetR/AcrR family transcriptional repressor of mexJK operon
MAASAGVSKVTIYNQFGDRTALFAALVARESRWMEEGLAAITPAVSPRTGPEALAAALAAFGAALVSFWARPDVMRLDLQVALLGPDSAEQRAAFHAAGPARLLAATASVIAEGHASGTLAAPDPIRAAEHLIALWRGAIPDAARFGVAPMPNPEALARRAAEATTLFLAAHDPKARR